MGETSDKHGNSISVIMVMTITVIILNNPFLFTLVFFFSCMKLSYEKVVYVDDQLSRGE
ncbi:hypothetical protein [Bacillus subtilis]|uniref:hypothetical protein n=1 Tax=Bacillus subtilis TaxID=1423 RepID=UPI004045F2FF